MTKIQVVFEIYKNDHHIKSVNESFDCESVETWADDGSLDQDWFWDNYGKDLRSRYPDFNDCDFDIVDWSQS